MNKPEFDQFASDYNDILTDSIPRYLDDNDYFIEYKIALMKRKLAQFSPTTILDFGCGSGRSLPYLAKYFPDAQLSGFDVSNSSLEVASEQLPNADLFSKWDALNAKNFDLIFAANVFHHIPTDIQKQSLTECRQALAKNGQMFVFEHNPFNPATRWVFERCPLDVNAKMIYLKKIKQLVKEAGFKSLNHGYTLFFPRQLAFLRKFECWLEHIPLGAQYYVQLAN